MAVDVILVGTHLKIRKCITYIMCNKFNWHKYPTSSAKKYLQKSVNEIDKKKQCNVFNLFVAFKCLWSYNKVKLISGLIYVFAVIKMLFGIE